MSGESVAFDRAAEYYDETRGFPPGIEQPVAEMLARVGRLNASSRVLEIGIGTGRIAVPLAPYVRAYYGVDLARPMIDKLLGKREDEPVYPVIGDARQLPFAGGSFDTVIAVHVFHLIPGFHEALDEVRRVLKPDGVLLHGWNRGDHQSEVDRVWNETVTAHGAPVASTPGAMTHDQRDTFLQEDGWQLQAEEYYAYTFERAPIEHLNRLRARMFSRQWAMSDEVHSAGIAAVEAYFAQSGIDPTQAQTMRSGFQVQSFYPPAG